MKFRYYLVVIAGVFVAFNVYMISISHRARYMSFYIHNTDAKVLRLNVSFDCKVQYCTIPDAVVVAPNHTLFVGTAWLDTHPDTCGMRVSDSSGRVLYHADLTKLYGRNFVWSEKDAPTITVGAGAQN